MSPVDKLDDPGAGTSGNYPYPARADLLTILNSTFYTHSKYTGKP